MTDFLFSNTSQRDSDHSQCLGKSFNNDAERRAFYRKELLNAVAGPLKRRDRGFPSSDAQTIVETSDPPYFTACPNPFLTDVLRGHDANRSHDASYERDPFA